MKLGMEIPTTHMPEISRLTDFDFAIAHRIVEDEKYRKSFQLQREKGRMIFLDNGFHERGNNTDPKIILQAQFEIAADYVISPDRIDDPDFTSSWLPWSLENFGTRTAAVIVGDELDIRLKLLDYYRAQYVAMICFPYRRKRQQWITEFDALRPGWDLGCKVHFLGMQDLSEARWCATRFPKGTFDTSKPIKWGYKGKRIDDIPVPHGAWPEYDTFLDAPPMDSDQSLVTLYNVCLLRRALV